MSGRAVRSLAAVVATVGFVVGTAVGCGGGVTNTGVVSDTSTRDSDDMNGVTTVLPAEIAEDATP